MSDEAQPTAADAPAEAPAEQAYAEYPTGEVPAAEEAPPPRGVKGLLAMRIFKIPVVVVIGIVVLLLVGAAVGSSGMLSKKAATPTMKMVPLSGGYGVDRPQVAVDQTDKVPIDFSNVSNSSEVTNVYEVTVAFSWTDDYAGSQPDDMHFYLSSPDNQTRDKDTQGTSGAATLTISYNVTDKKMVDNTKGWELSAKCVSAGGKKVGPIGFLIYVDKGNNYSAQVSFKYYGHETAKTTKK